jgi:fructose-1-phosphate kinase PfkB-like protein
VARGARRAIVTAAAAGAATAAGGRVGWLAAPRVAVRNPIGAGDAFVAGLGVALERDASWERALACAVAAGAASVETSRAGTLRAERADGLVDDLTNREYGRVDAPSTPSEGSP